MHLQASLESVLKFTHSADPFFLVDLRALRESGSSEVHRWCPGLGSAGAIFLAIYLGLRVTLLIGGMLYLCAIAVIALTRGNRVN